MSDDVLSVIPTDPWWQPEAGAAERAVAFVERLMGDSGDVDVETTWYDAVAFIDCGSNLERVGCPLCRAAIDREWWSDLVEAHCEDGFATLAVEAPCCGGATTLDALDYQWPCGFARFEIAVWNPEQPWFGEEELAAVAERLGHPVEQVRAHI